jgi:hypothetical protein
VPNAIDISGVGHAIHDQDPPHVFNSLRGVAYLSAPCVTQLRHRQPNSPDRVIQDNRRPEAPAVVRDRFAETSHWSNPVVGGTAMSPEYNSKEILPWDPDFAIGIDSDRQPWNSSEEETLSDVDADEEIDAFISQFDMGVGD